jgi:hypothetical protein
MMTISVRDGERYYEATVSPQWAARHNNSALVSLGLTVGHDLTPRAWAAAKRRFRVVEVTQDEYNHGGCQSQCIRRGNSECRW